ncbi:zinc ABC transporter substrate-binding protein [Beggiatoa alba]|uniref:zinc ABC transporter substrate-binding protein n=1 Tax=Beggiatoa alba TaxID=1022 RepID=UPI0012F8F740|nr:zinc ABC transporter substrate-binding protein [Beggiatoa alba]
MKKILFIILISLFSTVVQAGSDVVVTIKPIYALVLQLMAGEDSKPSLLLQGGESPHTYMLKPSQVSELHQAKLIIWVSPVVESFLVKPLSTIENVTILQLSDVPELTLLPIRSGGIWEKHVHHAEETHDEHEEHDAHEGHETHEHAEHDEVQTDGHLWLDPQNAIVMVKAIAHALSQLNPAQTALYQANAERLIQQLTALDERLKTQLTSIKTTPYIVFHDAYQYFERRYQLNGVGSITLSPENPPSAKRLHELRTRLQTGQVRCVFSEPQFEPKLVNTLIKGTNVKQGVLDPEGASLAANENLYFVLLENLANTLQQCLLSQ